MLIGVRWAGVEYGKRNNRCHITTIGGVGMLRAIQLHDNFSRPGQQFAFIMSMSPAGDPSFVAQFEAECLDLDAEDTSGRKGRSKGKAKSSITASRSTASSDDDKIIEANVASLYTMQRCRYCKEPWAVGAILDRHESSCTEMVSGAIKLICNKVCLNLAARAAQEPSEGY